MKYRIALQKSEEGYSVSVPGLPGCWSQGDTESEALQNIRDAIGGHVAAANEQFARWEWRIVEVDACPR